MSVDIHWKKCNFFLFFLNDLSSCYNPSLGKREEGKRGHLVGWSASGDLLGSHIISVIPPQIASSVDLFSKSRKAEFGIEENISCLVTCWSLAPHRAMWVSLPTKHLTIGAVHLVPVRTSFFWASLGVCSDPRVWLCVFWKLTCPVFSEMLLG